MSAREGGESRSKRLHSKAGRVSSPKQLRPERVSATNERALASTHNRYITNVSDVEQKAKPQLRDALPFDDQTATKMGLSSAKKEVNKRNDGVAAGTKRVLDPTEVPRARSYYQHDERSSAGQGGQGLGRGFAERGSWKDAKDRTDVRVRDKVELLDTHLRDGTIRARSNERGTWRHDGFYELEAEPPPRKRPAFREQKIQREQGVDVCNVEEKRRFHELRSNDKIELPDERNVRAKERALNVGEREQISFIPRDRLGSARGIRRRDRFDGRYIERNQARRVNVQIEKWKHDMFEEANRSPSPKKEEDQLAKIEALLAS